MNNEIDFVEPLPAANLAGFGVPPFGRNDGEQKAKGKAFSGEVAKRHPFFHAAQGHVERSEVPERSRSETSAQSFIIHH